MKIKKIFLAITLSAVFIMPAVSLANDYVGSRAGFGMMEAAEEKIMGVQAHEEMEDLMREMMSVDTRNVAETEKIADKLAEMASKYPGAVNMMMSRFVVDNMMSNYSPNRYGNMGMMGDWGAGLGSPWYWIMFFGVLVWVVAGVLLVIWLIKQIGKK